MFVCENKNTPHTTAISYVLCSPSGGKVETKSKLMRQLGETIDLSSFDYQSGRHQMLNPNLTPSLSSCQPSSSSHSMVNPFQRTSIRRSIHELMGPPSPVTSGAPRYSQILKQTQQHQLQQQQIQIHTQTR